MGFGLGGERCRGLILTLERIGTNETNERGLAGESSKAPTRSTSFGARRSRGPEGTALPAVFRPPAGRRRPRGSHARRRVPGSPGTPLAGHFARKMERCAVSFQKKSHIKWNDAPLRSKNGTTWRFLTIWGVFSPKESKHSPQIAVEWCSQNWNDTRALERFRQKHRRSVGATAKRIFFFTSRVGFEHGTLPL